MQRDYIKERKSMATIFDYLKSNQYDFDVIFSDINLGTGMSGYALAREIRNKNIKSKLDVATNKILDLVGKNRMMIFLKVG